MTALAVFLPALLLAVLFVAHCLRDLARAEQVRWLPKWAWGIVCVVAIPVGGLLYLLLARPPETLDGDG